MSWTIEVSDYLLGELDADGREEAARLMREDPSFRAEVERLRPVVGRLDELPEEAWTAEPPPLQMPPEIEEPRVSRDSRPKQRLSLRPIPAFAASIALLAVGVGVGALVTGGGSDSSRSGGTELRLAAVDGEPSSARAVAQMSGPDNDEMTLRVSGVRPTGEADFYEAWLLNDGDDLVSLGSFKVPESGSATITLPIPVDPTGYGFVDVSLEPADGKPGHSGKSVLRGPVAN